MPVALMMPGKAPRSLATVVESSTLFDCSGSSRQSSSVAAPVGLDEFYVGIIRGRLEVAPRLSLYAGCRAKP